MTFTKVVILLLVWQVYGFGWAVFVGVLMMLWSDA